VEVQVGVKRTTPPGPASDQCLKDDQLGFDVRDISVFLRSFIGDRFLWSARSISSADYQNGFAGVFFRGPAFGPERCWLSIDARNSKHIGERGPRRGQPVGGRFRHPSRRTALTSDLRGEGDSGQIS
jgi:hypothetical protein